LFKHPTFIAAITLVAPVAPPPAITIRRKKIALRRLKIKIRGPC
jgi:hypothetical protein